MTARIVCSTTFDITPTGVRNYFKRAIIPFVDDAGRQIFDYASWQRSRNQQRNWETVNQIISMRTLTSDLSGPMVIVTDQAKIWQFEFDIVHDSQVGHEDDAVYWLKRDAESVPMIIGLDEGPQKTCLLVSQGPDCNIWFKSLQGK